jgi:addiction module HigA family antidote
VLRDDFIDELDMTQGDFAKALGVDRSTISEIINGKRAVTPEMAVRLGHALGTSAAYWMNLQLAVWLYDAEHSPIKAELERFPVLIAPR